MRNFIFILLFPGMLIAQSAATVTYIPKHEELVYTFGGHPAKMHLQPGTTLVTWTEDCYDGAVKSPSDIPSQVIPPGHDNPQTGPFYGFAGRVSTRLTNRRSGFDVND